MKRSYFKVAGQACAAYHLMLQAVTPLSSPFRLCLLQVHAKFTTRAVVSHRETRGVTAAPTSAAAAAVGAAGAFSSAGAGAAEVVARVSWSAGAAAWRSV